MGGIPGILLVYFPAGFVLLAILAFPLAKLCLRGDQKKQKRVAAAFSMISILLLIMYVLVFQQFFLLIYLPLPILIPFVVLLSSATYFTYRFYKPADLQNYRPGHTYKVLVGTIAIIILGIYLQNRFPSSDREFISPDGKFKVLAYTGDKFGKTKFELYNDKGEFLGKDELDSNGSPDRDAGVVWNDDHVAIYYMCPKGDCHPAYIRLDGQKISDKDFSRFEEISRGEIK